MTKNEIVRRAAKRAYRVFVSQGWEWAGRGIPTVAMIEQTYHRLVTMAEEHGSGATGRLVVTDTDLGISLSLELGSLFGDED